MIVSLNHSACPLWNINAAIKVSAKAISFYNEFHSSLLPPAHSHAPSGIFVVGGGGYACSSFGAGSGHFEYFVVRLFQLVAKLSVFLVFSKCISVFCHACSWLAGVWLTTQKAPVAANTKYISLIFFR